MRGAWVYQGFVYWAGLGPPLGVDNNFESRDVQVACIQGSGLWVLEYRCGFWVPGRGSTCCCAVELHQSLPTLFT